MIKVTEENLSKFYKDDNENDKQIKVIKDTVKRLNQNKKSVNLNDLQYRPAYDKNVSKVVDENGEPLVVYHRTPNVFNVFDINKVGSTTDSGQYGKGFYFGIDDNRAEGNNLIVAFLNIKNPFYITENSHSSVLANVFNKEEKEYPDWAKNRFSKDEIQELNSKDGVIDLIDDNEFVVKNPNQIKSIDNTGEFSRTDDNIYKNRSVGKMEAF